MTASPLSTGVGVPGIGVPGIGVPGMPPDPMWPNAGHVAAFHTALGLHPRLAPLHRRHFARMTVEIIEGGVDHRALTRETAHTRPLLDACAPRLAAELLNGLDTAADPGRPDTLRRAAMIAAAWWLNAATSLMVDHEIQTGQRPAATPPASNSGLTDHETQAVWQHYEQCLAEAVRHTGLVPYGAEPDSTETDSARSRTARSQTARRQRNRGRLTAGPAKPTPTKPP